MEIMQLTQTIHLFPPAPQKTRVQNQPMLPGLEPEPVKQPEVTNRQVAEVLSSIAEILEVQNANPYRVQAYRHAARGVLDLAEPAAAILARGETLPIAGLGPRLRQRIAELVETGAMTFYSDLCLQSLPRGVRSLLAIRFIGVTTATRLYQELDIDSPEKLWNAIQQQRVRRMPGFGPRSEARLREALERFLNRKEHAQLGDAA